MGGAEPLVLIVEQDARVFMAGALDNKVVLAVALQAETLVVCCCYQRAEFRF